MRPRDLLLLAGALLAGTAGGVAALASDTFALEVPPPPPPVGEAAPVLAPEPPPEPGVQAEAQAIAAAPAEAERASIDTRGWTAGVVRGDVQISVAVLDRIESISVVVEELRNAVGDDGSYKPPHRIVVPLEMGRGTPTFEVRDIPFSAYPYSVGLYSPGLNGGRQTLTVDAENPLHDVVLELTGGAPMSLLLRDQDGSPHVNLEVRMVPEGAPFGRKTHMGRTDTFGSVVFENVLAGQYKVFVAQNGQPIGDPQVVEVHAGGRLYRDKIQGQGQVLTVPRGVGLKLRVVDVVGYGMADANVRLQASDRVQLTVLDAVTDRAGNVEFPYLTPGVWQIDVTKDDHQRRTRQVTIRDGQPPEPVQIQLVRVR